MPYLLNLQFFNRLDIIGMNEARIKREVKLLSAKIIGTFGQISIETYNKPTVKGLHSYIIEPLIQAVMADSVEALVFIVIGCSCSEGCGYDSHCRLGSFLRFNSRSIMSSPYCAT